MSTNAKIIIGVLAGALVLGTCSVCIVFALLVDAGDEWAVADARSQQEGMDFGRTSTTEGCIQEGLSRAGHCGALEIACNSEGEEFVRTCLLAVPAPDPTICDGIPPTSTFGQDSLDASAVFCSDRGYDPQSGCDSVFLGLSDYCMIR